MKTVKLKVKNVVACACFVVALLLCSVLCAFCAVTANAEGEQYYTDAYRNRLAFSAREGWNNDPNGLLYADGVYHMYFQYTWDHRNGGSTETGWNHMSWGHATSVDLVHWEEKPVAIPAYQTDKDGNYYAMMFSGSAVYDEYNTSGFFDVDNDGKAVSGQGIVAILTQPMWNDVRKTDAQRQILAYSKDGGDSFEIYGEVIAGIDNGNGGYEEFRDPKVFWSARHEKWLCAVGGGSVRMYSSDDLREWDYLGETGFWGECPDLSRFEIDGEEKYVLVISPEDKQQSHDYNGTSRKDTYYPAEYYVVGELDDDGLFYSDEPVKRLSEGLDSYAFQSFNNAPEGRVYGVSWSACWKNVGEYEKFRKNYNGGISVVCELGLSERDGEYVLTRYPVSGYKNLRGGEIVSFDGVLHENENVFADSAADVADICIEADFTDSTATELRLDMRVSDFERISLVYDKDGGVLTLDRSQSSLLAENTTLYKNKFSKKTALVDNKLKLRVLLDRAFVNVFANGGETSMFAAVFPTAYSNGLSFTTDGDLNVKATVCEMNGIFGDIGSRDELYVTTNKIDTTVGSTEIISAYTFADGFDAGNVRYTVESGGDNISIDNKNGTAYINALKSGSARVKVSYGSQSAAVEMYIYDNGFTSDVEYVHKIGGFGYISDMGLKFSNDVDAFMFSDVRANSFIYSATFTPIDRVNDKGALPAQAGGLVFGVCDNLTHYYVVTADLKDKKLKLWEAGVGDLAVADYEFEYAPVKLTAVVVDGSVYVYVGNEKQAALEYEIYGFDGGAVGVNVFNAEMAINNVSFTDIFAGHNVFDFGGLKVMSVTNADENKLLTVDDYTLVGGRIAVTDGYLTKLDFDTEYELDVETDLGVFTVVINTAAANASLSMETSVYYDRTEIVVTVVGGVDIEKVTVDGRSVSFTRDGDNIVLDAALFDRLSYGLHGIKAYTDGGRLSASFTYGNKNANVEPTEPEAPVDYTFLIIDLCIFAAIVIGYAVISIVLKRKKK